MSEREQQLIQALAALVAHARPAFPRTPYRAALDEARRVLAEIEEAKR